MFFSTSSMLAVGSHWSKPVFSI